MVHEVVTKHHRCREPRVSEPSYPTTHHVAEHGEAGVDVDEKNLLRSIIPHQELSGSISFGIGTAVFAVDSSNSEKNRRGVPCISFVNVLFSS